MAGWTCSDNDLNIWDGRIKAKSFLGDGSALTGITIGTETDPTFQAASGAYNTHLASAAIHFPVKGNGYFQYASGGILASGAIYTDGTNIGIGTTSPSQKLEIAGNLNIISSGSLTVGAGGSVDLSGALTTYYAPVAGEPSLGTPHPHFETVVSAYDPSAAGWSAAYNLTNLPVGTTQVYLSFEFTGNAALQYITVAGDNSGTLKPNASQYCQIANQLSPITYATVRLDSNKRIYVYASNAGISGVNVSIEEYYS